MEHHTNESKYVQECIDSTFVSSVGKFVDRFEKELSAYTGAKHSIAVVNGTAALQIALFLAGVRPGDEVLVPTLSFVATANAVTYCGAKPHFVDSEERTLGMDSKALQNYLRASTEHHDGICVNRETGNPIRAMVPVHIFGHPCNLEGLLKVAICVVVGHRVWSHMLAFCSQECQLCVNLRRVRLCWCWMILLRKFV